MKLCNSIILFCLLLINTNELFAGAVFQKNPNVFIISIGINDYKAPLYQLKNAVNDAMQLVEKVKADAVNTQIKDINQNATQTRSLAGSSLPIIKTTAIDSVYTYLLLNENASLKNIEAAFKEVASTATTNDILIFYFGGISIEDKINNTTLIIPFMDQASTSNIPIQDFFTDQNSLPLNKLAGIMEQVSCDRQLIISEAGNGSSFAKNLIASFFETNPLLSAGTSRNRIILTTTDYGADQLTCNGKMYPNGPLAHYLLKSNNLFDVFDKNYSFQYSLMKQDIECFGEEKYVACYVEKEYQRLFVKPVKIDSRGTEVEVLEEGYNDDVKNYPSKTYALVVGTNWYNIESSWLNLKNPINDATTVAKLLRNNYGAEVKELNDPNRDSLLFAILTYKSIMHEQDKFILFIAGHGHYSNELSDGFLVTTDSKSLNADPFLDSYLQMAKLHRLVDNLPSKNVFVIFDVCFGATFDLNAPDVDPNRYTSTTLDVSIDEFIKRQSEKTSRVFLASGRYTVPDYWNNSLNHSPFATKLITALDTEKSFTSPGKILNFLEGNATTPILKQFGKHEPGADFLMAVE